MRNAVEALKADMDQKGAGELLRRIVEDATLHARFLNTLSRMEYTGVRKILKSRRSERLDLDGIEHVVEESVHALRLKKAALSVAPDPKSVETYGAAHTLGGDAGEAYIQAVDHASEGCLAEVWSPPEGESASELNYVVSSTAIEVRAMAFYPLYESALVASRSTFSVRPILRDEDRHLDSMSERLTREVPAHEKLLARVLVHEAIAYDVWFDAIREAIDGSV